MPQGSGRNGKSAGAAGARLHPMVSFYIVDSLGNSEDSRQPSMPRDPTWIWDQAAEGARKGRVTGRMRRLSLVLVVIAVIAVAVIVAVAVDGNNAAAFPTGWAGGCGGS